MSRLLYVDDESALLELGKLFLEMSGVLEVDTAVSASEAIEKLRISTYDGIISDYSMPGMDGIAFLKYVREQYNHLPFILFTGRGREEIVIEALNSGADFYLQKGGDPKSQFVELEYKIRAAIERRQFEAELRESRQRMTDIIDHLPDATFAIDLDGTVISWNRAMEEMTGVNKEEILGSGDHAYALPFYGTRRPVLLDLVLRDDPEIAAQYPRIIRKDNKLISEIFIPLLNGGKGAYLWFIASPLYDTHGTVVGAIESIRDISDRKMADDALKTAYEQITAAEEELREQYDEVKKREEALRESEENYRTLFNEAADLIAIVDTNGVFLNLNRRFAEEIGYQPEEMIGKNVLTSGIVTPASCAQIAYQLHHLIPGKNPPLLEIEAVANDGTLVPYELRAAQIIKNGRLTGVQAILRNITERKTAEREIRESRNRLEEIVHGSPIPQFVIDKDHVVISWNKALEEYSGVMAGDVIGTTDAWKAFYETKRPVLADLLVDNAIEKIPEWYAGKYGRSRYVEGAYEATDFFPRMGKTGTWLYFTASTIRDSEGSITGAIETLEDVTGGKLKEAALLSSEEKYRILTEKTNDIIYLMDLEGRITHIGPQISRYGYTQTDILMKNISGFVVEDDLGTVMSDLEKTVSTGQPTLTVFRVRDKSGTIHWMEDNGVAVFDNEGRVTGISGILRDITERRLAEEKLRESEEKFRDVFNKTNDAIQIIELDETGNPGRFLDVNEVACSMVQYRCNELLEKSPFDLETGYASKSKDQIGEEIRTRGSSIFETEYIRKDGVRIPVEINVHSAVIQEQHVYVAVVRDITGRKKTEDELRSAYKKIATAERELRIQYEELQKSGEALRASEAIYRTIFYNTGSATIIIEEDTTISFVNPEFERITGYTKEEVEGKKSWIEIVVPEDAEMMNRYHVLRRTDPLKAPRNYEFRFITKDRQVRNAYLTIGLIPGSKKTVASFIDSTEIKRAEIALRESEKKYRDILENIQDAYYRSDRDGNLIMISPSGVQLLRFDSEDEMIGKNIADTMYADSSQRRMLLQALEKDGFVSHYEVTLKRHDGSLIPVETSSHKYYDGEGNFLGVEGIFRDITERKRAEAALQGSEATYCTIVENTGTATVLIEEDTTISLANAEFERLSGYSREEIQGKKRWTEFVAKEDQDRMLAQHRQRREDPGSAEKHYEFRFVTKSGAIRNIFLTIDMIPGTRRSVASLMDITRQIATRDALEQTNKKLNLINSITLHDIRNQLNALSGYPELSRVKVTDPELAGYIKKEETAVDVILGQIEFAKNYEDIGTIEPQWQDPATAVPRSIVPPHIAMQADESGGLEILADPMLPKVFFNLIENSLRHGQTVTAIRISYRQDDTGRLVIVYEDNGIGIPPDEKERIFNREYGKHTGLGLFLSREILGITGITLRETGEPGKGVRFVMLVPEGAFRYRKYL